MQHRFALVGLLFILALLPIPVAAHGPLQSEIQLSSSNTTILSTEQATITVCHRPPGNPLNAELIQVGEAAVDAHIRHGDPIGDAALRVIHVDAAAPYPGNGRSTSPFRRISDALELARCIRQAERNFASAPVPLEILVAPGSYVGTFDENELAADGTLEELPLLLNVPNLLISGATTLALDERLRPIGPGDGSEQTYLSATTAIRGLDTTLMAVTDTTDGMAGNRTTVQGFTFRSGNPPTDSGGVGIVALRVSDLVLRNNSFEEGFFVAIDPRAASGEISTNFIEAVSVGMFIEGPGSINLMSNRVRGRTGGIYLATAVEDFPFDLGTQVGRVAIAPFEVPAVANIDGSIVNNDLSGHRRNNNWSFGLRLTLYGFGTASAIAEQRLTYQVEDNTINDNVIGVWVDAGYSERNDLTPSGAMKANFHSNEVSGNCRSSMTISFTHRDAALFPEDVNVFPYLQDAIYELTFDGGDEERFDDRWIDHPLNDPVDGRELNNQLIENGVAVDPGTRNFLFDPSIPCATP